MHVHLLGESWRRIDSWLAAHAPRTFASLRPPASQEAISAAAAELGVEFPVDLVAYLRHHDGVSPGKRGYVTPEEGGFTFPGFQPYTLAQILSSARSRQESWARYEGDPLLEHFWHHDFVPFARNISADGLVVDCRRGESFGAVGLQAESEGVSFGEWESLAAFLEQVADSLEGGTVMTVGLSYVPVVDDGMLLWELAPERRHEPRSLFDLALADPVIATPRRPTSQATLNKTWPSGYDNFCLTFAQALDETELLRRFGALPETRRPRGREEAESPDQWQNPRVLLPVVRVGTHGGWAFGLEEGRHIFEGTRDEVLRRVSRGTRAVSVSFRGESGPISVSLFDNGELVTKYHTGSAVLPDGARDPFEVFPGLPPHDEWAARWDSDRQAVVGGLPTPGQEPTPQQWQERLLAVCDTVVRSCGTPLPPPGLDGELDSARILPLLPDNNFGLREHNFRIPVPDRFTSLVDAATPERLRRALASQMSSLATETGLDTYDEVTAALSLLSGEDRPGITDDSALDLRLRRVYAEAQVTYADWNDRSVWQDRAMAARALADALNLPAREALGLVVSCRQNPQWRREFRKQLTDD
ncbi:SMI1/KNR4 family protein [Nocardia sp. CDC159]|uniref:SMI1/KNR4 family protein n=1 Tax=Nocardia pulmonis TaxID=2951408 RepID=A0A9X2E875_9NOCA|nr:MULTISPECIES: SMI1/KNR4 family protein [Nocardia]MCM6773506.1 SMI1/KNR4 family protein [Nocardia pulmonis]MCM6786393.1 SMI1/KNR4 family protein [Nocardia sp. CDC159]